MGAYPGVVVVKKINYCQHYDKEALLRPLLVFVWSTQSLLTKCTMHICVWYRWLSLFGIPLFYLNIACTIFNMNIFLNKPCTDRRLLSFIASKWMTRTFSLALA